MDPVDAKGTVDQPPALYAVLHDASGRPLMEQTVLFGIVDAKGAVAAQRAAITDLLGRAHLGQIALTPGKYTVGAAFDGNDSYAASATAGTLTLGVQLTDLDDDPPVNLLFLPSVESQ